MSKLSSAHYEIARWIRWRVGNNDDVEVNADVQHYHRADGYRNITVSAESIDALKVLHQDLLVHVQEYGERLRITVDEPQQTAKPGTVAFYVSIWPVVTSR